jgi:hypothetical protein
MRKGLLLIVLLAAITGAYAQTQQPQVKKSILKDTLDHQLDFSKYLIDMHGFIPWPSIISEPALGNFGIAMALVFISPKESERAKANYIFPDITAVAGMWTLNNSWGVGALRQGTFPSIGMRYRIGVGYAPLNVEFYRTIEVHKPPLPDVDTTRSFLFNLKPIIALVEASENLYKNKIFAGLNYMFSSTKINYALKEHDTLQKIIEYFHLDTLYERKEIRTNVGLLGFFAEWDNRNSTFTADKGIRFRVTGSLSRNWLGSTDDFEQLEIYTNIFFRPFKPWVCGFKAEWDAVSGEAPFYMLPYLNMRGLPAAQYQGQQALSFETEQRFDFNLRWSVVGFVGTGRTFSSNEYLQDNTWYWAGGAGFRYLVARLFKLRMGIDIARGPDQFAYYIVFGHYWDR